MSNFQSYQSPFSWRYGSQAVRQIWSEDHKRRLWRRLWVALAQVEMEFGLVLSEQVEDLRIHQDDIDIPRAMEIESEIQHDLMAELKTFAEQCPLGGGILHLGATSMDIEDNADALRIRESLGILIERLGLLLREFARQIETWADIPIIAFTHLQPAEPTTLGYRLAFVGQDLLEDYISLQDVMHAVRGKGFKGAVGTGAAYTHLIGVERFESFENRLSEILGLEFFPVSHQTYPRKQDYRVLSALAGVAASLSKFAYDLRLLQSPGIGEMAEPFGSKQVGSSAMPFKRNPIRSEKIDSLARIVAQFPRTAWDNAALSFLERTLDDSANRRSILPEAFLACDELIHVSQTVLSGLMIDHQAINRNLDAYGPFAATERILMAMVKSGADRQEIHEHLRQLSMRAWEAVRQGNPNPLKDLIVQDTVLCQVLSPEILEREMDYRSHVGIAPQRSLDMAIKIQNALQIPDRK